MSTHSLADLYRFAMNFLLERKRKRKKNRDGRKGRKRREKAKRRAYKLMDDHVDECESARLQLEPM